MDGTGDQETVAAELEPQSTEEHPVETASQDETSGTAQIAQNTDSSETTVTEEAEPVQEAGPNSDTGDLETAQQADEPEFTSDQPLDNDVVTDAHREADEPEQNGEEHLLEVADDADEDAEEYEEDEEGGAGEGGEEGGEGREGEEGDEEEEEYEENAADPYGVDQFVNGIDHDQNQTGDEGAEDQVQHVDDAPEEILEEYEEGKHPSSSTVR